MLKWFFILPVALLAGCGVSVGPPDSIDWTATSDVVIATKTQTAYQHERGVATYMITSLQTNHAHFADVLLLQMPADFGNANDSITFTNGLMQARPRK